MTIKLSYNFIYFICNIYFLDFQKICKKISILPTIARIMSEKINSQKSILVSTENLYGITCPSHKKSSKCIMIFIENNNNVETFLAQRVLTLVTRLFNTFFRKCNFHLLHILGIFAIYFLRIFAKYKVAGRMHFFGN